MFKTEFERERDERWIAEAPAPPGVLASLRRR
jgi:hypothetical protein